MRVLLAIYVVLCIIQFNAVFLLKEASEEPENEFKTAGTTGTTCNDSVAESFLEIEYASSVVRSGMSSLCFVISDITSDMFT